MKSYPSYTEQVSLLSSCYPSHWRVVRNRVIFHPEKDIVGSNSSQYELLSLTTNGIIRRDVESGKGKFPKDFDSYQVVKPGEMVFCLFDVDETPRTVGLSSLTGMVTGAYDVFSIAPDFIPGFINYYYTAVDDIKAFRPYYTGLRKVVKKNKFMQIYVPVPSKEEQRHIVEYLDKHVNLIESLKSQREKELLALNELRIRELSTVVTHGLNTNVPMKDSGISWIGQIPAHWEVVRIKHLLEESKKKSVDGHEQSLSLSKNYGIIPYEDKENKTMQSESLVGAKVVDIGDIVFNRFKARLFAISPYEGVVSPDYAVYKGKGRANLQFLTSLFSTPMYRAAFDRKASGIGDGFSRLYTADLFSMYAILPPLKEQDDIVDFINSRTEKMDSLTKSVNSEIKLLDEYKQRLISDVVTGKINVQE